MQSIHPLKADVHIAAAKNDSETVQNLINNDRTLLHLVLPDTGESLVHIAALYDAHDVLELLYGEGADFTSKTSDGKTVVHCAASSGSAVTLRCLLSKEGMSQLVNSPNKVRVVNEYPVRNVFTCTTRILIHMYIRREILQLTMQWSWAVLTVSVYWWNTVQISISEIHTLKLPLTWQDCMGTPSV